MAPAHLQLASWRLALPPLLFLAAAGAGASSPPAPAAARAGAAQRWARVPLETGGLVSAPCPDGVATAAVAISHRRVCHSVAIRI